MSDQEQEIVSIVMLLRQPRTVNLEDIERAAECAFEVVINDREYRLVKIANRPMFALRMP